MSAIGFYAHGKEAQVRGSERAYASIVTRRLALSMVIDRLTALGGGADVAWDHLIAPPDWVQRDREAAKADPRETMRYERTLELWLGGFDRSFLRVGDAAENFSDLALNTAIYSGSPAMRLLAYVDGTCESFGYFEPPHRDLIDTILNGLVDGVLRVGQGWEHVAALASETRAVIVMDYSVSDSWSGRGLKKLRDAWWPRNFGPSLKGDTPEVFSYGKSAFDFDRVCFEETPK